MLPNCDKQFNISLKKDKMSQLFNSKDRMWNFISAENSMQKDLIDSKSTDKKTNVSVKCAITLHIFEEQNHK